MNPWGSPGVTGGQRSGSTTDPELLGIRCLQDSSAGCLPTRRLWNTARHAEGVTLITLPPTNTSSHTKKKLILSLISNSEILEASLTVCSLELSVVFFLTFIIKSVSCGVPTQEPLTSVRGGSPGIGPHTSLLVEYICTGKVRCVNLCQRLS